MDKTQFVESEHPRDDKGKFVDKDKQSYREKVQKFVENKSKSVANPHELMNSVNDSQEFENQIIRMKNNELESWNAIKVKNQTPRVLQDLGFQNLPMLITQLHAKQAIGDSNENIKNKDIPLETFLKIPFALDDPNYVLKSKTNSESVVCVTSLKDKLNRPIIVSIFKDGNGKFNNIEIQSNFITSVYGRNNFMYFINENRQLGNILYEKK